MDPYLALSSEVFTYILGFLDYKEVLKCGTVSKSWLMASKDNVLWVKLCNALFEGKVYLPQKFIDLRNNGQARKSFFDSLKDSERTFLTTEELCSFTWDFRFKSSAGEAWIQRDPWWMKKEPIKRRFHLDGTCSMSPNAPWNHDGRTTRWKFVAQGAGRKGPMGSFIQVDQYPTYIVSRHKENWGFILQSCWVVYTSFPMPPLGECEELEDAHLDVHVKNQHLEAMGYNTGLAEIIRNLAMEDDDEPRNNLILNLLLAASYHADNGDDSDYEDT
eukprot:TRINITY_DN8933_c0_g1_i1.p1 TRINITY_DN8933_c0_g1~~TRINITY_DN8933_c0_g1_i1.p1  ORF type:complete len:286 (+),score=26.87 TRINITY_DN8933_c0_g1_i1:39-860(+)